ncbi:MAG: VOC family protein [Solirubrobacterales bacterium]|nr:VOC family protein [Solirubrobacterales bacterium]
MRRGGNLDHLWIRVADLEAATRFYATIAPHAGIGAHRRLADPPRTLFPGTSGSFSVVEDGTPTAGLHLAFPAADDEAVRAFHRAALEAGYADNGAPGERPQYHPGYYAAFVRDPDGANVEVVNHHRPG